MFPQSPPKNSQLAFYNWEDRRNLRQYTAPHGTFVMVDGLGLFSFYIGSTEPDDDESCFVTGGGAWLLECPHWDVVEDWQLPDSEYLLSQNASLYVNGAPRWTGRIIYGTANNTITSITAATQTSFTATVNGAAVSDNVIITASAALPYGVSKCALVTSANTVTIYLNNASAATQTLIAGTWGVVVIKTT